MNNQINEWLKLTDETKSNIFIDVSNKIGLPPAAIEKDWWVVHTLRVVFSLTFAEHLVFKGGTSLSKAWDIIKRFSEDVDLVLNREFIGFKGELSKSQVKRLRETSCKFICDDFLKEITQSFNNTGLNVSGINVIERNADDTDPVKIEVRYKSLFDANTYLQNRVLIEIGSRSLIEPFTNRSFTSFVGEIFNGKPFADIPLTIPVVNPERTLLEKIFLLHEEFQKEAGKIKVEHMSRHHYDIIQLMDSKFAVIALNDANLFDTIVQHRKQINFLNYVDYSKHSRGSINIIPPNKILSEWEKDYSQMSESMIYGDKPSFQELLKEIESINSFINNVK